MAQRQRAWGDEQVLLCEMYDVHLVTTAKAWRNCVTRQPSLKQRKNSVLEIFWRKVKRNWLRLCKSGQLLFQLREQDGKLPMGCPEHNSSWNHFTERRLDVVAPFVANQWIRCGSTYRLLWPGRSLWPTPCCFPDLPASNVPCGSWICRLVHQLTSPSPGVIRAWLVSLQYVIRPFHNL